MNSELLLERSNRMFNAGENIRGVIRLRNLPGNTAHDGVVVRLEGSVKGQMSVRAVGALDSVISQVPPENLCSVVESIYPPGMFMDKVLDIPFALVLQPLTGKQLLETYTGVYISVTYELSAAIVSRQGVKSPFVNPPIVRILVMNPSLGRHASMSDFPTPFTITKEDIRTDSSIVHRFNIAGVFASGICQIDGEFSGYVSVVDSSTPVRSIDLQLMRIETVKGTEGQLRETTEVQCLQIADGDVRRNAKIPLHMNFPRQFSCPTSFFSRYKIEFEAMVIVKFVGGVDATRSFPITLVR
jgi:hypothetical protein